MRTITAALAGLGTLMGAAVAQDAPAGRFDTAEAAACGAVFASLVQAFQETDGVPEQTRTGATVGLMFWEYELSASAPGQEAMVERTVIAAFDQLNESMPQGEGADAANARGDYLMRQAQDCSTRIDAAYPEGVHPVEAQLRAAADAQGQGAPAPSLSPERAGADAEAKRKPSRLR